jgi:hypothetical protein
MRRHVVVLGLTTGALLTFGPGIAVATASPESSPPATQSSAPSTPASSAPAGQGGQTSPASLSLRSDSGAPGSKVEARLACLSSSRGIEAPGVFRQQRLGGAAGALLSHYTVSRDAKPGSYTVHAHCGDHALSASYRVSTAGVAHSGHHPGAGHEVSKVPEGAPNTGGGATAEAPGPWLVGLGGAALLGGTAAAATAARKRTGGES